MNELGSFNIRSDSLVVADFPGKGDDIACVRCRKVALDTGLECSECGYDNYYAVYGEEFTR